MSLYCRHKDNLIYNVNRVPLESAVEPWTLDEVKEWLTITFSDDDAALTRLIPQIRDGIEMYCHISMIAKTITVDGEFYRATEFPYGPVAAITSVETTSDGSTYTADTSYKAIGPVNSYKQFIPGVLGMSRIVYTTPNMDMAQYQSLSLDGLRITGYCWENRGDQPMTSLQNGTSRPNGLHQALELFAKQYRRLAWV